MFTTFVVSSRMRRKKHGCSSHNRCCLSCGPAEYSKQFGSAAPDILVDGHLLSLPKGEWQWLYLLTCRYYLLISSKQWNSSTDVKILCSLILAKTLKEEDKYQIGLTKIFFRAGMLAYLESLRTSRLNELVTLVQKNIRRRLDHKHYQETRRCTIRIQAWWRGILAQRYVETVRRETAAVRIQRVTRGWLARTKYHEIRQAVIKIQASKSLSQEVCHLVDSLQSFEVIRQGGGC